MRECASSRFGRCARWLVALTCLGFASPAWAQDSPDELGRRHFESGEAYFKVSDYENALREFTQAYELSKRPEILLSIATVHERMGHLREAVTALEGYLAAQPEGKDAETVRIRVANLKKRLEAEPAPSPAAPAQPTPSAPAPAAAAPKAPLAAAPSTAPAEAPSEPSGPNVPALLAIGVGGLATVGAVVTGILAKAEYDDTKKICSPHCTDHQLAPTRTLAWTSTALTGVAIVGVGLGVTLLLVGGHSKTETPPSAGVPRILVGIGPRGGSASASWRF